MLIENLLADLEWRISELSRVKTIPIKYSFNNDDANYFYRLGVVSIYAIWEGFIHNLFESYIKYINSLELEITDINIDMLTFYFDAQLNLRDGRTKHDAKKSLTETILSISKSKLSFNIGNDLANKSLKSNVNYKILKDTLSNLAFDTSSISEYQNSLNKLINFRNKIAHGDGAITVSKEDSSYFVDMIENIMQDILIIVEKTIKDKSYMVDLK